MTYKGNEKLKYGIPVLITLFIYCVILCVKHIFPFGTNTIDYYDMAQQIAAFYYHVHDMLHGKAAFFYSYYSALGTNMAMSTSGCSNLSLFNLFFLLVPRDYLLESLSLFHLLKLMVMTFTMYFYLHKTFRLPWFFEAFLSVSYAFSGYVLLLYITNQWMDVAALFPLLMYFYDKLMKTGNTKGYVVLMSLILITSYYLSAMIFLYLILYTGIKVLSDRIYRPKGKRKRFYVLELGFASVLSIVISLFIVIPQLVQTLSSARFENGSGGAGLLGQYLDILKTTTPAYTTRWFALFNISFSLAAIFVGFIKVRRSKRLKFITVGVIFILVMEFFLESINLIWHFGSYVQYPIRNGFIIHFAFISLAGMYLERLYREEALEEEEEEEYRIEAGPEKIKEEEKKHAGEKIFFGFELSALPGLIISVIIFSAFVILYNRHQGIPVRNVFHITALMMGLSFIGYVLIFLWKGGRHYSLSLVILCTEFLCYGFLLYGQPTFVTGYGEENEQEGEYIRICRQLKKEFELEDSYLYRVKNPDESLNSNYGFVLRNPALSNWTHMISPTLQKSAAEWGYTTEYTRILDAGGTAFTDALIGIDKVISAVPLDERLYKEIKRAEIVVDHISGETAEYILYSPEFILPFGVPLYANAMFDSELENRNIVSLQNQMYRSLTGADTEYEQEISAFLMRNGQIIDESSTMISDTQVDESGEIVDRMVINTSVKGEKALYFNISESDREDYNISLTVINQGGSREVSVPSIKEPDNIFYPAHFNNNAVCLGTFKDETVTIIISSYPARSEVGSMNISELDLGKLRLLCDSYKDYPKEHIKADKKTIEFSVSVPDATGSVVMLLPIAFDEGWSLRVNGKKSDIMYSYSGLFTAIPLYSGENIYSMSFFPKGMMIGIVLSLVGLVIYLANLFIRKKKIKIIEDEVDILSLDVERWLTPVFMAGWALLVIIMYLIPIGAAIIF